MAGDVTFDFEREQRIGLGEAVFCAGKTTAQISAILTLARERERPLLLTRLTPDAAQSLSAEDHAGLDYDPHSHTAILGPWQPPQGTAQVAVVTAGTSDVRIAGEAIRTLAFSGLPATAINDVGVAGLWRILARENELRSHPVVIVIAGMEGALFSVVTGMVAGLVIAVPTSIGYGVSQDGRTALHSALASCAPGLVTVNIDNGYGAACAAIRALRLPIGAGRKTQG
ncbi:MAG: nickel pincer cofactor biosynthesis protein LarB [Pseudomonadota bacterium]